MQRLKKTILTLAMIFSLVLTNSLTAFPSDTNMSNKENTIISKWTKNGVIKGYPDGSYKTDQLITRAELAAVISRIFAFTSNKGNLVLSDVSPSQWYSSSVHQIVSKGIMDYTPLGSIYIFHPNKFVNYQEAIGYLSKLYNSDDLESLETQNTNLPLTRLDLIMLINQLTTELISQPCTYSDNITGNLVINTSNVILKDMIISGNLYLSEGIGDGAITLDNVRINGTVYVNGCGENSLLLKKKTHINSMVIENHISTVRLIASSEDTIKNLVLFTPTILDGPITLSDPSSNKYAIYPSTNTFITNTITTNRLPTINLSHPVTNNPIPDSSDINDDNLPIVDNLPNNTNDNNIPIVDTPPNDANDDNTPIVDTPPNDANDNNTPIVDNPPNDANDDNTPIVDTPPNDTSDDNLPIVEQPDIDETETLIGAPTNIDIDFSLYPSLIISWDPDPLVSSYALSIKNTNDSTTPLPLYTTSSIITLDSPQDLLTSTNDYSIEITAISNDTSAATIRNLTFPTFKLQELSNGSLSAKITDSPNNTIPFKNLNLGLFEQDIYTHQLLAATTAYTFKLDSQKDTYLMDVPIKNDVIYTLKILGSYTEDALAYTLCNYDATYFANVNYRQLISSTSIGNTASTPIELTSIRHLNNLSSFVADGNTTKNKYFKLLNDLDFSNPLQGGINTTTNNFNPIGISKDTSISAIGKNTKQNKPFEGNFDGANHIISNMRIYISEDVSSSSTAYVFAGLFGFVTGNIENITLDSSCSITVNSKFNVVGGIVACASYTGLENRISNCHNYASIYASRHATGIVGVISTKSGASSTVIDCYNYGPITSNASSAGILNILSSAESSTSNVISCYNLGTIKGETHAGGIVSQSVGSGIGNLKYCNNFGDISTERQTNLFCITYSGGIISYAHNPLHIAYCVNGGAVTSNAMITGNQSGEIYTGGIIGSLTSPVTFISYSYNFGDFSSTLSGKGLAYSGDILARPNQSNNTIDCYAISHTQPTPDSSQGITFLHYEEFINSIKETLPHLLDYITSSI